MSEEDLIEVYETNDFRKWLDKNHLKKDHVLVIIHKKHTGKNKTSAAELMKEAICFGWIDTTIKRIDEEKYAINYRKRNKNSKWSYNTLRYAKELLEKNLMAEEGIKWFKEGLKKRPHDFGIPKKPEMPEELRKELEKKENKKLKEAFDRLSPSVKKTSYRWIIRAKRLETKKKRVNEIVEAIKKNNKLFSKDI